MNYQLRITNYELWINFNPPSPFGYSLPAYLPTVGKPQAGKGRQKLKGQDTPPRPAKLSTPQEGNSLSIQNTVLLRHFVPPPPREDRITSCKKLPPRPAKLSTPSQTEVWEGRKPSRGEFLITNTGD